MNKIKLVLVLILCLGILPVHAQNKNNLPKREFRGAWIHIINNQFLGKSNEEVKRSLIAQLDALQEANINAVIFQVRAEGDAFYKSKYEPWSRYLTGVQGLAPVDNFDPLEFMVTETHKRGMELHAWINPYRAVMNISKPISPDHYYFKYPERFIAYGNQVFFDPSLPVNREHICTIVKDIVTRYDIDAIHMDDYFYPYPKGGMEFDDAMGYARFGRGYKSKEDWRRDNVNILIKSLHEVIHETKPWVRFGVSPFGIYRNENSDPFGSRTNGLQNYDDLYADVILWVNKGWVDYNIPQVYWHVGHPVADYGVLVDWWAKHSSNRPLYIGQSIPNTIQNADPHNANSNQLPLKMKIQRSYQSIGGSSQWPAVDLVANKGLYKDALSGYFHKSIALPPTYSFIDNNAPKAVRKLKKLWTIDGYMLFWTEPKSKTPMDDAKMYVIYQFEKGEKIDLENPANIVKVTSNKFYKLPYVNGYDKYTYIVTALDRVNNESKAKKIKVRL